MTLATLLRDARELPVDATPERKLDLLAELRTSLARGIDAHRSELREFLTLSGKFASYADAWNASRLLEDSGLLDPHGKAIQVTAWFHLFPEAARTVPKVVLSLLGPDERGGLSDAALSGLLARWLDHELETCLVVGCGETLIPVLLAASELASCWWPEVEWATVAPAFAASFVDVALRIVRDQLDGKYKVDPRLVRPLGVALLLRSSLDIDDTTPDELAQGNMRSEGPRGEGDLIANVVARLNSGRKRIWVVGALRPKWEHLMGVAKSMGLGSELFEHVGYDQLRGRSLPDRIDPARDFGVLLGPIPHSVGALDGHTSLATQLTQDFGINVVELRNQSLGQELKISKTSFKTGLERLLAQAASTAALT